MSERLLFTVTTDLTYDQRMKRICSTLADNGYDVCLVGRTLASSVPLEPHHYQQKRLRCWFSGGKFFYLEFTIRLFFLALFKKYDRLCAVDMDTLPGVRRPCKWRGKTLIFDAHEYFSEVIEVARRPKIQKVWRRLEQKHIPKVDYAYTVNQSLADIFTHKFGIPFGVIRNISSLKKIPETPNWKGYIIYIGAVNDGRGLKELIGAMPHIDRDLRICGKGDLFDEMVALVNALGLQHKVHFDGFVEPDELAKITQNASLGYLLLENIGLSYYYSLANKFYDYIHAGIPQVCIDFPEYRVLNQTFDVASLISLNTEEIVSSINQLLTDEPLYRSKVAGALKARAALNWEKEGQHLVSFYNQMK